MKLLAETYDCYSQRANSLRLRKNRRWVGSDLDSSTRYQSSVPLICLRSDYSVNQSISELGGVTKALQQYRKLTDALGRPLVNLVCERNRFLDAGDINYTRVSSERLNRITMLIA
jgi:hypothetical protein